MLTFLETEQRLEIHSHMRAGARIVLGLVALFPLLAPYELLLKTRWQSPWNLFFLFAALVSLGAIAVSALVMWAALAGMSISMVFDRPSRTLTITRRAPVYSPRPAVYSLASIQSVAVEVHEWSDSAPDYSLSVTLLDGKKFTSGMSSSRVEIEGCREKVLAFLGWEQKG